MSCGYNRNTQKWVVKFNNGKTYSYAYLNVEKLTDPEVLNPNMYRISREGREFFDVNAIYVFRSGRESYWHICFGDGSERDYRRNDLHIIESCLTQSQSSNVFEYIKQIADLITFDDEHFNNVFPLYLNYTLIRQKYGEKIRTPLYEDIQYDYPLSYYLAQIVSQVIKKHTKIPLSRSEITNFTILFNNTINNKKYSQKKVLLINCMSESIKTFINHFIEKELYDQLVITKSIHYYEIEEENLDQYDLILSTAPIHRQLPIPVISVNYIMSQDDIIRIKSYLSYLFNDKQMLYYFHPSFYKTHVQVKTLKGLATNFYQLIKTVYHLNDSKKNDIMNKNICSIHTFENSIGLLRLTRPLNSNNIISIVTLEEPMKVENQTFNIAILFSCADNQNVMYNTLFSTLKNISENKEDLDKLISHIPYTEFLSIILKNK